jgi:hypothetical protein
MLHAKIFRAGGGIFGVVNMSIVMTQSYKHNV